MTEKQLFLIDGIGALVSAILLGIVLPLFPNLFKLPIIVLYLLACLAAYFAIYSLSCAFIRPKKWQFFMKGIAIMNNLYCGLTLAILLDYLRLLSWWDIAYFVGEVTIILPLVRLEWKMVTHSAQ